MAKIDSKYEQEFRKLSNDWQILCKNPNMDTLNIVMKDIQQLQQDLRNLHF